VGTICLNVTRIFSISLYGYLYATSGDQLNAFHNVIGEVLFPIWIVAYLVVIIHIEDRLTMPAHQQLGSRRKVDTASKVTLKPNKAGGKLPRKRLGSVS
jgi:thaumarchaeosortase